jgi:hypothetical protein
MSIYPNFTGPCFPNEGQFFDNSALSPSGFKAGGELVELENPECCAYTQKMQFGRSIIDTYHILTDIYKQPCNPFDGHFDKTARTTGGEDYWKFQKVERDIFDIYRKFLLTRNTAYLNVINNRL